MPPRPEGRGSPRPPRSPRPHTRAQRASGPASPCPRTSPESASPGHRCLPRARCSSLCLVLSQTVFTQAKTLIFLKYSWTISSRHKPSRPGTKPASAAPCSRAGPRATRLFAPQVLATRFHAAPCGGLRPRAHPSPGVLHGHPAPPQRSSWARHPVHPSATELASSLSRPPLLQAPPGAPWGSAEPDAGSWARTTARVTGPTCPVPG